MTDAGAKLLAIGILQQAILDYKRDANLRPSITKFAHSLWCDDLCEIAKISNEAYRKRVTK